MWRIVPQPGLPGGVLTFSIKECVQVDWPSGSPSTREPVPPAWARWFPLDPSSQKNVANKLLWAVSSHFRMQISLKSVLGSLKSAQSAKSGTHVAFSGGSNCKSWNLRIS